MKKIILNIFLILAIASGCQTSPMVSSPITDKNQPSTDSAPAPTPTQNQTPPPEFQLLNSEDLENINKHYNFTAKIPLKWRAEYIPAIEAINIYNPDSPGGSSLEQSQIFIRYFQSSKFLTLNTVKIFSTRELEINNRPAVLYDIEKKAKVSNFPNQPSWRSKRHPVTDIRSTDDKTSTFYVFARRPDLEEKVFNEFLNSIKFNPKPL